MKKSSRGPLFLLLFLALLLFFVWLFADEQLSFKDKKYVVEDNVSSMDLRAEINRLKLENDRLVSELNLTSSRLNQSQEANWSSVSRAVSGIVIVIIVVGAVLLVVFWLVNKKPWKDLDPKGMDGIAFRKWAADRLTEEGFGWIDESGNRVVGKSIPHQGQWIKGSNSLWLIRSFALRPLVNGELISSLHFSEIVTVTAVNTDVRRTFQFWEGMDLNDILKHIEKTQNTGFKPVKTDQVNPYLLPGAKVKSFTISDEEGS